MLLDLRSLLEVGAEEYVAESTNLSAEATSAASGTVTNPEVVFPGGFGGWYVEDRPRRRDDRRRRRRRRELIAAQERVVTAGVAVNLSAPATSQARGQAGTSPRVLSDLEALVVLGYDPIECLQLLDLDGWPPEPAAQDLFALALMGTFRSEPDTSRIVITVGPGSVE